MRKARHTLKQAVLVRALKIFKPQIPKMLTGSGSSGKLAVEIKDAGMKKVLIVTDKVLMDLGLLNALIKGLDENGVEYAVFDKIQPDPSIKIIEEGFELYMSEDCDGVVGFGGGSSMDSAKIIASLVTNNMSIKQMATPFMIRNYSAPLFFVPTTAGTGSEVTIYAIVSDYDAGIKIPVVSDKFIPKVAAIDPDLMKGLPSHITAATGMDALTHAVEAYISTYRDHFQHDIDYCLKATKLIIDNLETAYNNPEDIEARNNMGMGSHYAGIAFRSISCGYVHGIAHRLGEFYHVPHGLGNAIVLPKILDFSFEAIYKDLAVLARVCHIGTDNLDDKKLAREFIDKVKEMNANMHIPETVKDLKEADFDEIIKRVRAEASQIGPPMKMSKDDIRGVLETMLEK